MGSNDISNPEAARDSLVAALTAKGSFQAVYGYLAKDLLGQSPVAMVERMSTFPQYEYSTVREPLQFAVWVWVDRSDAAAAEDLIDALAQDVAEVVDAWHNAEFFQQSEMLYADADNNAGQYRVEIHYVQVDWE